MSLLQTRLRWQTITSSGRPAQIRVAILATFTANPVMPYLGTALEDDGMSADVWTGPYNQIVQECLSDDSRTARLGPDILVSWPRLEELWGGLPLPLADDSTVYIDGPLELAEACLEAARRWRATLVFVLPEIPEPRPLGLGDACIPTGVFATATMAREALRRRLAGQRGVLLIDLEEAIRALGSAKAYNPRLLAIARIPFSEELFRLVGQQLASLIRLTRRPMRKVLVVDADNTLWGGVVSEEDPEGVDLSDNGPGEAYRSFQSFLLELRRTGVLLALCSKNNEADVWKVFSRREMRLKKEHFAAWRIGWQAKPISLREIAEELKLGVDSFVLIDDSPAEIAEVQASLPEVACIRMPNDPAEWLSAIKNSGVLDRLPPTAEDLKRSMYYEQERLRRDELTRSSSPAEYLAQLAVKVRIFSPTSTDLPRFTRLVAKTNQFNLNCRRRTEIELSNICTDKRYLVRLVHAEDRLSDYGVVGAFIVKISSDRAELDTFLLSCRAMGRGIEEAMVAYVFEEVARMGHSEIFATVEECSHNEPARRFFANLGCEASGVTTRLRRLDWPSYLARL